MSKKYNDYLHSDYWRKVSDAVKRRAGYCCQVCNSQHDLQAHHRTYAHRFHELDHLDDLTCLCRRCHGIFHGHIQIEKQDDPQPRVAIPMDATKTKRFKKVKQGYLIRPIIASEIDGLMPDGDIISLTKELIDRCRVNGAFTSATIRALGVFDTKKGWPSRLEGTQVNREQFRKALEGRNIYASAKFIEELPKSA